MGIELVLPQSRTPAVSSWIIERGIFMCIGCKYLLTAGLREQNINVTQLWPGILKFSRSDRDPNVSLHSLGIEQLD